MKRKYIFSLILVSLLVISIASTQLADAAMGKIPGRNIIKKPIAPGRNVFPDFPIRNTIRCYSCENCTKKINQADPGTVIKVMKNLTGSYDYEISEKDCGGGSEPVISKYNACIFFNNSEVTLDCNGRKITGNNDSYGIFMRENLECINSWTSVLPANKNIIKNCKISNYEQSMYLWRSENGRFVGNTLKSNRHSGIMLFSGKNNTLLKNTFKLNLYGLFAHVSNKNNIKNNKFSSNFSGITMLSSDNNLFKSNNVNSNRFAIHIENSNYNKVENNDINNNIVGLRLVGTLNGIYTATASYNTISNNKINSNQWGIYLLNNIINTTLESNIVCYNQNSDIEANLNGYGYGNQGEKNRCDKAENWNDNEKQGCTLGCGREIEEVRDLKINF